MDKESCSPDPERRDKSGLMDAARTLDPSSLFAYWPRGDSGTSAATNALFGAYGSGSSLAGGRGSYGGSGGNANVPNAAAYGNTLSVAASQAASLGINPASAAWWTVASHLAAQDYLARLHSMSFAGLPGAESLYPNFILPPGANSSVPSKTSKSNSSSLVPPSKVHLSSGSEKEKENYSTVEKERDRERIREKEKDKDRDRDRDRERERERERVKEKEKERERERDKDNSLNISPMTAHSGSKSDHLASIAALANSGTSVTPFPPQAHSSVSDPVGMLGGVRLPPDTEIIKYTSSIGGPKIPGTTNRGRKKTISLDPPSVSVMPTHSSTGIPIDLGQPYRSQMKLDSDGGVDQVEVIKLPAHSSSNGVAPASSETGDDAPLNLCTKSRDKDDSEKDRISRRKPVPKPRRPPSNDSNPITSLSAMSQIFTPELNSPVQAIPEEDTESTAKDGRPRNLGRGVSKPKKNTVASLLAQSRALGLKGTLPGDFASQLAALKSSLPPDITSQLALLQNFQSVVEDVDGGDKRSLTPENSGGIEEKSRVRTSEDGSLTTDSTSTGGSDSESENGNKIPKCKKDKNRECSLPEGSKLPEKNVPCVKIKDEYKETKSPQPPVSTEEQKRNSVTKDPQLYYTQEINKQKELLYAVELEKERRRQHMTLIRALENRKRIEERERKRIELRAEKIARHEKKIEQRRLEIELLKELRKPTEDMELDDLKPFPELSRIGGLKLSGQAFADTLMVFEFLHNFGETLGFDMESLPTLNNLQGALLNDEENEEELLSIMTHLLVCAIEDPGIPNPARHITLLGQSLKQADITHTNISEILRIYLYANATGEVKALTGLNFERDREKKISEHHNLYGEEAQNQGTGKNAAFFEHLHENATYKLSEELKEKPFLALNPTTKSAILAFLCNELLQNKAVLRQIEGSLETVILSRRERWVLDQSIRKLRCLHDRQIRYSMISKDKENIGGVNPQVGQTTLKDKTDGVDSDVESPEDSDHESEITQPEIEDDQQQNLNSEEISKRLEKLIKQQESHLATLRTSNQQIRAMCLGQDRFWRRYWCLRKCGSVFVESMESAQPDEYSDPEDDLQAIKPAQENENLDKSVDNKNRNKEKESDHEENSSDGKSEKRKNSKRKSKSSSRQAKKSKLDQSVNSENDASDCEDHSESNEDKTDPMCTPCEVSKGEEADNSSEEKIKTETTDVIKQEAACGTDEDDLQKTESEKKETKKIDTADVDTQTGERDLKTEEEIKLEMKVEQEVIPVADGAQTGGEEKAEIKVQTELNINNDIKKAEEYLRVLKDPMKEYSEKIKELSELELSDGLKGMKYFKEYFLDMSRNFEGDMHLKELAEKCRYEDDPLLKAMKKELSTRIFGPLPGNAIKKEDFEDPQLYRNSESPLANGDKFAPFGLLPNSFNLNRENDADAQWFSILPKESCDPRSLMLGKNESEKLSLPLNIPSRGGLPPSPGPIPLCDSPAPLILSPEEAYMLEQMKTSGPKPTPTRKTIPKLVRRGWWKITDEKQLHDLLESLHNRGIRERELKRMLTRYLEDTLETGGKVTTLAGTELMDLENSGDFDGKVKFLEDGAPVKDQPHSWDQNVFERVENLMLEQVENLEDKVASASMQVKGWRIPSRSSPSEGCDSKRQKLDRIEVAKQRLISLEAAIERRYLKPPLGFSTGEGGIGIQADQDESIPKGRLGIWREAVSKSHTAAQLSMALYMLESCIAWDKSIMKANCQFCQSGDNEDKLLLCDGCDRGYHMYCFKPKMDTIPDGDWYCHECKNKSNGERNCIVCGKRPVKNFVTCEHCPRIYHADCLNPPLLKIPRNGKWNCVACAIKFPKKKCGRKLGWRKNKEGKGKDDPKDHRDNSNSGIDDKTSDTCDGKNYDKSDGESDGEDMPLSASFSAKEKECVPLSPIPSATCSNSAVSDEPPPLSPQPPTGISSKKERSSKKLWKEMNACKTLVEEMELQDEAWPFLLPVNTKQFPTYRKIIKCPMDISTIKKRLTDGLYKTKEEFVFDVRQIFNNCETFNEDDSPVGKAGHAMRSFFETRWGELTNQKTSP